jgi:acyl transferase domain-containing protein
VLKDIKLSAPNKEFISNLTGEVASGEVTTVDYWCKQLRNTVHFSDGVSAISQKYNHGVIFIEVGPGKGLSYFVNKFKNKSTHKTLRTLQLLPSLKETQAGEDEFLLKNIRYKEDILSRLWISGIIKKPNDDHLVRSGRLQIGLPVYQFNHHKCWFEKRQRQEAKKLHSIDDSFYERSWERVELNSSPDNSVNLKHIKHSAFNK